MEEQRNLPATHILVYPNNIRVLVQDEDEFLIPDNMALVDDNDDHVDIPEYNAVEIGKLIAEDDIIQFYVRDTKIAFLITLHNQLKIYINDNEKCNASYRMMYFSVERKLWVGKHCIQFPVYLASFLKKSLKNMARDAEVLWIEDKIEFLDDQKNFIQLKKEMDNICLYRNGKFFTAPSCLDYYPQKQSIWTGKIWIDVSGYLNAKDSILGKRKKTKLAQFHALFAQDGTSFIVKELCGYPHCGGVPQNFTMNVFCNDENCQLKFHQDCAEQMSRSFKFSKQIKCPLHYEQVIGCLEIPTFAQHLGNYDLLVRSFPPRPVRSQNKRSKLRALKLTKKESRSLEYQRSKSGIVSGAPVADPKF